MAILMEKKRRIIITELMGFLPLLFCIIYCAGSGKTPAALYLPNSYCNDELFYYKQVEGVLKGGIPGGYFGYNESHAQMLSFGVWSPFLMLSWIIWGFFFGWNLLSPFLCNLIFLMLGLAAFAWLARPGIKQAVTISVLLGLFRPFTRFIMCCRPETFCCTLILIYMGCAFAYEREQSEKYIWLMYGISALLTLMRPYFLLFMLYPVVMLKRNRKVKCAAAAGCGVFVICYMMLIKYLCADYLLPVMNAPFLEAFRTGGFAAGLQAFGQHLTESAVTLKRFLREGLNYGNFPGSMYGIYGSMGVMFLIIMAVSFRKRKESPFFRLALSVALGYTAMMAAIVCVYSFHDSGYHLITFVLTGILVLGMYSAKFTDKILQVFLAGFLLFFFFVKPGIPYDRELPFKEEKLAGEIEEMSEILKENMTYVSGISWENTVIWLSHDFVGEETVVTPWQQLYALPGGCGINFCYYPYVEEHVDELKARYIVVVPDGQIEEKLKERGDTLLGKNESIAVYRYEY